MRERTKWNAIYRVSSWMMALLLVAVMYVLSYAPYVRWRDGPLFGDATHPLRGRRAFVSYVVSDLDFDGPVVYRPVDWLIDHTPMRKPYFSWADIWGVKDNFLMAAAFRMLADPEMVHAQNGLVEDSEIDDIDWGELQVSEADP